MSSKHYHVFFQTVGCLPDDNVVCDTRKQAEECARDMARDCREMERKVSGSARSGYYSVDAINCITIETCNQEGCNDE